MLPERTLTQDEIDAAVLHEYMRRKNMRQRSRDFLHYVSLIAPWFVIEEIHILIAQAFDRLAFSDLDRLMVFLAPRAGKSQLSSIFLPAWWIGLYPTDQILHTAYAGTLVEKFGRQIRNMLLQDAYKNLFPDTVLTKDSKAAAQWATTMGGVYNAAGVGAGIAGKGFNLGLIDDPISEQDMFSRVVMERVWEWYGAGFYTRRQPERNKIVLVMTRWNVADLAGHLLAAELLDAGADKWEVIKVPALITEDIAQKLNAIAVDPLYKEFLDKGKHPYPMQYKERDSFSPRRWPYKELMRNKAQQTKKVWASLYMQEPYEESGGILPRDKWRKWDQDFLPNCDYIIQSYDTAFEEKEVNDFTVRTTWGLFQRPEDGKYAAILLERKRKRMGFPELREDAWESYQQHEPDKILIEKKASGHSLIQELRKRGLPIAAIQVKGSKLVRAHVASIMLEQGFIYYVPRNWADEIIDECAAFPNTRFDDCVDSCVQAWMYLRRTFHLRLTEEDLDVIDDIAPEVGRYKRYFNPGATEQQ
jgi:predicted phage terminase large subunit-like protein